MFRTARAVYDLVSRKFLGDRQTRYYTLKVPALEQRNAAAAFNATTAISVSADTINVLNSKGVFSGSPAGGLLASLYWQAFLPTTRCADPAQQFNVVTVQPRTIFVGASVKF